MQAFESAARHGSFTQAAIELDLTQSAVSRQIRTFEIQLGVTLFERVRKRVVLSSAGKALLPEISRLMQQTEDIILRAKATAGGRKTLSIAALPTFGSRWLMHRLPDFLNSHKNISVNLISRSEPFDLMAEDCDLAIHYGQPVWAHATCTYLCSEVIVPVGSPALLERWQIAQPADMAGAPLLHLATRPRLWSEWLQSNGCEPFNAYQGHRFDQFSMIIEAAFAGIGFALLPKYLIEAELAKKSLVIVFDKPIQTPNNYYVVLPEGKADITMARTFQNWLMAQVL
eukprot:gene7693-7758_t